MQVFQMAAAHQTEALAGGELPAHRQTEFLMDLFIDDAGACHMFVEIAADAAPGATGRPRFPEYAFAGNQ